MSRRGIVLGGQRSAITVHSLRDPRTRLRLIQTFLAGVALVLVAAYSARLPYHRDLQQDYLSAVALRNGVALLTPLADLAARYYPAGISSFPHPNPHPPLVALLMLPLTALPYQVAALVFLSIGLLLLVAAGRLLALSWHAAFALSALPPGWLALWHGSWEPLLLVLCLLGWGAAERGQDWRAGLWLGAAGAVKLYPTLFAVPFLLRRRWAVVLGAALSFGVGQGINLALVGWDGLQRYYTVVLPLVVQLHHGGHMNTSPTVLVGPAASLLGLVALFWLPPRLAPLAVLVLLPNAGRHYALLALPSIPACLGRSRAIRGLTLVGGAAAFWPVPGLLQPLGYLGLLLISLYLAAHSMVARTKVARTGSPVVP